MQNLSDAREFEYLKNKYGKNAVIKQNYHTYTNKKFYNEFNRNIETDRRGEVAFFLQRKNGRFVLVRTSFYPQGLYRVPTGGIQFGESVEHALFREIKEELGVEVEVKEFLGVAEHNISYENEKTLNFCSFVFWLNEVSGELIHDATQNEISGYIEADKEKICEVSDFLKNMNGKWKDWSSFRYETTGFIIPYI